MPGISHHLMTRIWPKFKGRFLVPSITDANWHGNICSVNICPENNCPYPHNLSCYWPNFDQTFGTHIFAAVSQLLLTQFWPNFCDQIFGGLIFYGPIYGVSLCVSVLFTNTPSPQWPLLFFTFGVVFIFRVVFIVGVIFIFGASSFLGSSSFLRSSPFLGSYSFLGSCSFLMSSWIAL